MNLLAIDTSSSWCSVALSFSDTTLQRHENVGPKASHFLLPWIQELLKEAHFDWHDLDALAVGIGPGAFTGVRLAVAVAQGLAYGADLPVLPVTSLDAMAAQALLLPSFVAKKPKQMLVALDARMGEVYWASYDCTAASVDALAKRLNPISLCKPEAVDLRGADFLVGNAAKVYSDQMPLHLEADQIDSELMPSALGVMLCAKSMAQRGEFVSVDQLEPLYVRNKVAFTTLERAAGEGFALAGDLGRKDSKRV
jgi:tRNA threonylcarbamoyladenosine biosynthesis protein TsaB